MVIVYDKETKRILYTEDGVRIPVLPIGTEERKREILNREGRDYIGITEELGSDIVNYRLNFDTESSFVGLEKRE